MTAKIKVFIYEDSVDDLIKRYSHLTKRYDLHVRYEPDSLSSFDYDRLAKHGFEPANFIEGYEDVANDIADFYFLDGLDGYCFHLLNFLQPDKSFINSDSPAIEEQAEKLHYNSVGNKTVEGIIKQELRARMTGYYSYFARLLDTWNIEDYKPRSLFPTLIQKGTIVAIKEHVKGGRSYITYYNLKDGMIWRDDMVPFGKLQELDIDYDETFREGEDITDVLKRLNTK